MGLEAVVVGGIQREVAPLRNSRELAERRFVFGQQRFFDENVLAAFEQAPDEIDLGGVRGADEGGVERGGRDLFDAPELRLAEGGINGRPVMTPGPAVPSAAGSGRALR